MDLETIELHTGQTPDSAVIWLHGLGADGNDFVPLVPELQLTDDDGRGPVIRFVFPNAPMMPVTINNGYVMRAWYDILAPQLERQEDEAGLRRSQAAIARLIDHEIERGIDARRIVLAGFSQGCAMTLMTGLRYPKRLAGLIGLSGYLPLAAKTAAERIAANADVPILLAHGTHDPVIPIDRAQASRQALVALGYSVQWHDYPMPHSVCAPEVEHIGAFLRTVLPAKA